tara:strand:+ start:820 stop:990 length:171 start_codon:yes stop_codon:yes gene_type:complete
MVTKFFDALLNFLTDENKIRHREYMVWAKTEYKKDWKYAYDRMCLTGKAPENFKQS